MKQLFVSILLAVIFCSIVYQLYKIDQEITLETSYVDGKEYFVLRQSDSKQAANQLAEINQRIRRLFSYCGSNHPSEKIKRMINNYDPKSLSELNPKSKYTAYSLNKGEKIKLCLRDDHMNLINDLNTSMFVMCHELSHLMTEEEQHPPIFWDNMVELLEHAQSCGIYDPVNYNETPVLYGSNYVRKNPLFTQDETDPQKKYPYLN